MTTTSDHAGPERTDDVTVPPVRDNPVLLERAPACRRLYDAVVALQYGRSGLLVVTGQRGHGLSAMLAFGVERARAAGLQVATARCSAAEAALDLGVVLQLTRVLPGPSAALSSSGPLGKAPVAGLDPEGLVSSMCAQFVAAAADSPLLIVVDDLQWADPLSGIWLRMMAHRRHQAPLLILCASQTQGPPSSLPTAARWSLQSNEQIALQPLSRAGVQAAIAQRFSEGGAADPEFVEAALRVSGGVPAVLQPALQRLQEAGRRPTVDQVDFFAPLARRISDERLRDAVGSCPADALGLLQAMAVCGAGVGPDLLAALVPTDRERLVSILAGAALITEAPEPRPVDEAATLALAKLSAHDRAALGLRAVWLARRAGLSESRLAAVLMAASPTGQAWCGDVLHQAASRRRGSDDAQAGAMLRAALREPISRERREQVLVELGMIEVAGRPEAADRRLHEVLADRNGSVAHASVMAADLLVARGDARGSHRSLAAACLRLPQSEGSSRPLIALAWAAKIDAGTDPALPVALLPALHQVPLDPIEAGVVAWLLTGRGTARTRARALARRALYGTGPKGPFLSQIWAARVLACAGDISEAVIGLDEVLMNARRRGARVAVGQALLQRGWCELRRGNLLQVQEDLLEAGEQLPLESWHPRMRPAFMALRAGLCLERGDLDGASSLLESPPPQGSDVGMPWAEFSCARGALAMAQADPHVALAHFRAAGRTLSVRGFTNPAVSGWQWLAAASQLALGDRSGSESTMRQAMQRARCWGAPEVLRQAQSWAQRLHTSATGSLGHGHDAVAVSAVLGPWTVPMAADYGPYASAILGGLARPPGHVDTAQSGECVSLLSQDEWRVAVLAVGGRSNSAIAQALSLSVRAVEARLTATYRKLSVSGREQLAVRLRSARAAR